VPRPDDEIRAEIESGAVPPLSRLDELEAFGRFVAGESHALVSFAAIPGYLTQQAFNAARAGPVADRAGARIDCGAVPCALLRLEAWRSPFLPRPAALRILEGNFYRLAATRVRRHVRARWRYARRSARVARPPAAERDSLPRPARGGLRRPAAPRALPGVRRFPTLRALRRRRPRRPGGRPMTCGPPAIEIG